MSNFCLLPSAATEFKKRLKSGQINPVKMAEMSSAERREVLSFMGEHSAREVNRSFEEKLLLKNQQQGMITWIKRASGMKPDVKRDLITKVGRMREALTPESEQAFLEDLVSHRLGVGVTTKEAARIAELSENVQKQREKMEAGGDRMDYGIAVVQFNRYVTDLKAEAEKFTVGDIKQDPFESAKRGAKTFADVARAMKSSMDNSAIFRQGWKTMWTNPNIWRKNAMTSFNDIYKTVAKDTDVMDVIDADIVSRENYDMYKKAKLAVSNVEEAFPTDLPSQIPGFGRLYRASQDAYTAFLYRQRADIFDKLVGVATESGVDLTNKTELLALGKMVNSLTGRGDLGKLEPSADFFNSMFFSPRLLKSHIDTLLIHPIRGGQTGASKFTQQQAAMNLLKVISGTAFVLTIANAMLGDDAVEKDPRSANFGKIQVGNTRFDVSGGMSSIFTLAARVATQSSKSSTSGNITKLNSGDYGSKDSLDVIYDFFENKLAPSYSFVKTMVTQKTFAGDKPTVANQFVDLFVPIPAQNSYELLQDPESANVLLAMIADGLGIGTNTYGRFEAKWQNSSSKTLAQFKEQVGEDQFKAENKAYNDEYNSWLKRVLLEESFSSLTQEERERLKTKKKNDLKKAIFERNNFKYQRDTRSLEDIKNEVGVE